MKKILLSLLTVSTISLSLFAGCGNPSSTGHSAKGEAVKVGMVTDSGTIDDKSFNQGTWDGMKKAEEEFGVKIQYLQPGGVTESDYTKEIANLYDAGYRLIITPGYKFETAVFASQDKYPDANFLLVDGEPNNGKTGDENILKVGDNTAYEMIKEYVNGSYPGGTVITFDITNDGVGIPAENPNLTEETVKTVDEVITKMKDGSIKVSKEQGNLIK